MTPFYINGQAYYTIHTQISKLFFEKRNDKAKFMMTGTDTMTHIMGINIQQFKLPL
jgi:hypothetical protein